MRPTTFPARSSSIHFWTSAIGSSFIGVGIAISTLGRKAVLSQPTALKRVKRLESGNHSCYATKIDPAELFLRMMAVICLSLDLR